MIERWSPSVTVAVIVERSGEFLMVEEEIDGQVVLNQPAGHLERGESLVEAAEREVFEETLWRVRVTHLIGVHRWSDESSHRSWLRFVFCATANRREDGALDPPVLSARWMNRAALEAERGRYRSPLVAAALQAHDEGSCIPLSALRELLAEAR